METDVRNPRTLTRPAISWGGNVLYVPYIFLIALIEGKRLASV